MDQPRIAVEGEYNRLVGGEQGVEVTITQAIWMLFPRLQGHQVDDIDDTNLQRRQLLTQDFDRGQGFEGGHIARAGHHHNWGWGGWCR